MTLPYGFLRRRMAAIPHKAGAAPSLSRVSRPHGSWCLRVSWGVAPSAPDRNEGFIRTLPCGRQDCGCGNLPWLWPNMTENSVRCDERHDSESWPYRSWAYCISEVNRSSPQTIIPGKEISAANRRSLQAWRHRPLPRTPPSKTGARSADRPSALPPPPQGHRPPIHRACLQ